MSYRQNIKSFLLNTTKHQMIFLCLTVFPLSASIKEEEIELKTAFKDLRTVEMKLAWQSGDFPSIANTDHGSYYTDFCEGVPSIAQAQRVLMNPSFPLPSYTRIHHQRYEISSHPFASPIPERLLISSEDRRSFVVKQQEFPYRFQGRLEMIFAQNKRYMGSGTLVGPHHVLTAGHNLYVAEEGGWPTQVIFYPALYKGEMSSDSVEGSILLTMRNWMAQEDENEDIGMVVLNKPLGYQCGWAGLFAAADALLKSKQVKIAGYPGEKGPKDEQGTLLFTMKGPLSEIQSKKICYQIDTTPGQSGSNVLATWEGYKGYYTIGVHGYGGKGIDNFGARITEENFSLILSWMKKYQLRNFIHPSLPSSYQKALKGIYKTYKDKAKKGDGEFLYLQALCYQEGQGVKKNYFKAFNLYKQLSKQNHAEGKAGLARCYLEGWGTSVDIPKAISLLQKTIEDNNPRAQNTLGTLYSEGQGVTKDEPEAVRLYKLAAEQGHARAQNNLGDMYDNGRGVAKDKPEAVRLYKLAADQGHARAQCNLGVMYEYGQGVAKDEREAVRLYKLAADQGDARAQNQLKASSCIIQ